MALRIPAFNDARTGQYGFEWLRGILEASPVQEGVLASGDFAVTAAAGGGMRVDVAAGIALIKGDSGVAALGLTQGLFMAINDALVANAATFAAADPTNPRIDQLTLRLQDTSDLATGADVVTFDIQQGVPTAGATLDNRNGAPALFGDRIRLADVLIPAGSVAVTAGNIRDRRPWARGANGSATWGAGTATSSASNFPIGTPVRLELGQAPGGPSNPLTIELLAGAHHSVVNGLYFIGFLIDGAAAGSGATQFAGPSTTQPVCCAATQESAAAAGGSHLFQAVLRVTTAGTVTMDTSGYVAVIEKPGRAGLSNGTA